MRLGRALGRQLGVSVLTVLTLSALGTPAQAQERLRTPRPPFETGGTVMVPMRPIFDWLNAPPIWDARNRGVRAYRTLNGQTRSVEVRVGYNTAWINGKPTKISHPPVTLRGTTFIPLRFVAEAMGVGVQWDRNNRRVLLNDRGRLAYLPVPRSTTQYGKGYDTATNPTVTDASRRLVGDLARRAVVALRDRNYGELARLVEPGGGIRLSPSTRVNTDADPTVWRDDMTSIWSQNRSITWGADPATGQRIQLTPRQYYQSYVYDRDWARAPVVNYQLTAQRGRVENNILQAYPGALGVEYNYPASTGKGGGGGTSLFLVFTPDTNGRYWLRAIVHS